MLMNLKSIIICLALAIWGCVDCSLAGPLANVSIIPPEVGLAIGASQKFKLIGEDADGNEVPISGGAVWSTNISGCFLGSNGIFTAGRNPGKYANHISI